MVLCSLWHGFLVKHGQPCRQHYNLNLQSISVKDKKLSIDPSVFESSSNRKGTVIDSGTTLGYLAEEAYNAFVNEVRTKGQKCHKALNFLALLII